MRSDEDEDGELKGKAAANQFHCFHSFLSSSNAQQRTERRQDFNVIKCNIFSTPPKITSQRYEMRMDSSIQWNFVPSIDGARSRTEWNEWQRNGNSDRPKLFSLSYLCWNRREIEFFRCYQIWMGNQLFRFSFAGWGKTFSSSSALNARQLMCVARQ